MINFWGAIISALLGGVGWVVFAFVGTPIRKFWDLRGEVALGLNKFARLLPEMPEMVELHSAVVAPTNRAEAAMEFRRLGLALLSFWQNEYLVRVALKQMGYDAEIAAKFLLAASEASMSTATLGPRRSQITAPLRLDI